MVFEKIKAIYSSEHLFLVNHMKELIESYGIECLIKNSYLAGGAGELPPTETWPRLYVLNDEDFARAMQLVEAELARMKTVSDNGNWQCPHCGEDVDANFVLCWNCGYANDPHLKS